jgi:hypothetical protein
MIANNIFHYSTDTFPFATTLSNNIGIQENILPYIHMTQNIDLLNSYYCSSFAYLYKQFIKNIIKPIITVRRIYFTIIPKIYINTPKNRINNIYSNQNIDNDQLTVILPITPMFDTNTFWFNQDGFKPVNIDYGQFILLDQQYQDISYPINQTSLTSIYINFNVSKIKNIRKDLGII